MWLLVIFHHDEILDKKGYNLIFSKKRETQAIWILIKYLDIVKCSYE